MLTWSVLTRTDRPEGGKPRVYESKHYQSYADAVSVAVVALFLLMSMADVNVLRNRAREVLRVEDAHGRGACA